MDDSIVENKALREFRLRGTTKVLPFPVANYRCGYRSWEGFIPSYFED
jgi:hypothetical protein